MCHHGNMFRTRRRSFTAGVGGALLAAIVLCPLMVTAAATPAAASCHDRPAQDHHGDTSVAFTCCATVVATPSMQAAPEGDAAAQRAVEHEAHPAQRTVRHADRPRPGFTSPPLFVRHASLLI